MSSVLPFKRLIPVLCLAAVLSGCAAAVPNGTPAATPASVPAAAPTETAASAAATPTAKPDSDVRILSAETAAEAPAKAPKLEIKLRKQPQTAATAAGSRAPVRRAAPLYAPPPKPQLSRKQVLQNELSKERSALARTRSQLEHARKQGGNTAALQQAVRDREASIRAMQDELSRLP